MKTKIICEIGSNWESLDDILWSCDWAIRNGCVPKLQMWKTSLVVNKRRNPNMYATMKKYELDNAWVKNIKKEFPQTCYSVFDLDSLKFLENEICPDFYKVASPDCVYMPLLRELAKTRKDIIMSVGGATLDEIRKAVKVFDWRKLTLMHCVVDYPCKDSQLGYLKDRIGGSKLIGWGISSHSLSKIVPAASVALGAVAVECHFKISSNMTTPDSDHSFTPIEFREVIDNIKDIEDNCGNNERPLDCEKHHLSLGRRKGDGKR